MVLCEASEIQGPIEFVDLSINSATDKEFMSSQKHIEKQIQEQCKKHECINLIPAEFADVGVQVACAEGISDLSQKNAKVLVLKSESYQCTVEGPGTEVAEVRKSAQFTICTAVKIKVLWPS